MVFIMNKHAEYLSESRLTLNEHCVSPGECFLVDLEEGDPPRHLGYPLLLYIITAGQRLLEVGKLLNPNLVLVS